MSLNAKGHFALVVAINYTDCTNFEGDKVLVYIGIRTVDELLEQTGRLIDPHFAKDKLAPFMRFEPTPKGWAAAIMLTAHYLECL